VQVEPLAVLLGEREAQIAARDGEHEVDALGCDELRREDQVALVLAVLIVGQDDHLARAQVGEAVFERRERREGRAVR